LTDFRGLGVTNFSQGVRGDRGDRRDLCIHCPPNIAATLLLFEFHYLNFI
jgi:hypothetical protein